MARDIHMTVTAEAHRRQDNPHDSSAGVRIINVQNNREFISILFSPALTPLPCWIVVQLHGVRRCEMIQPNSLGSGTANFYPPGFNRTCSSHLNFPPNVSITQVGLRITSRVAHVPRQIPARASSSVTLSGLAVTDVYRGSFGDHMPPLQNIQQSNAGEERVLCSVRLKKGR